MISNKPNLLVNLFFVINAKDPNIIEIAIIVTPKYIKDKNGFKIGCTNCNHGPQNHEELFRKKNIE